MANLLTIWEDDESIYYRVPCECGDRDHDIEMHFSLDKRVNFHTLDFSVTLTYTIWTWPWYKNLWHRIVAATKILFKGEIKYVHDFHLDKKNIAAFKEALDYAEAKVNEQLVES